MSDLDFVRSHIPGYREYMDEAARHDSDIRVRAFVGERLVEVQARLGTALDGSAKASLEAVMLRCMFTDQVFVHNFEHATLEPPMLAALVRSDRTLVELAERLNTVAPADVATLCGQIDKQLDYRRAPDPVTF